VWKALFGRGKTADDDLYRPRMPEVDSLPAIEDVFRDARQAARGATPAAGAPPADRHVIVVTPGRLLMQQPCPAAGSMPPDRVASIEQTMPSAVPRAIAVIAYTELEAVRTDFARAIPFAGMLLGFAYIGHAVWAFEGHASALAAGCRDADVLLVDGGMAPYLAEDWARVAATGMRHKEIYLHNRKTFGLTRIAVN
jgi:hypothetical protein